MNIEIITWSSGRTSKKLTPSEGYKNITDGDAICPIAYLSGNADTSVWHDTNDEPIEVEEAEVEDYQSALEKLGMDI